MGRALPAAESGLEKPSGDDPAGGGNAVLKVDVNGTLMQATAPECPLFPKAVIRNGQFALVLMSAFGQERMRQETATANTATASVVDNGRSVT